MDVQGLANVYSVPVADSKIPVFVQRCVKAGPIFFQL